MASVITPVRPAHESGLIASERVGFKGTIKSTNWLVWQSKKWYSFTWIFSGGVSHQLSATRLLSSPEGSRHPLDGLDQTWPWNDSYSSLHRDTYTEVRVPRRPVFTWGCFRACRSKIHQSLAKRKVNIPPKLIEFNVLY